MHNISVKDLKVKTGSTNQVSPTNTTTASLYSASSQSYQNKGCWPSQWSGGCGKWDAVVILKDRNKRDSVPLIIGMTHCTRWAARECWRAAVYPAINELARASTNSVLLLHTLSPLPGHGDSQARSTSMPTRKTLQVQQYQ